MGKQKIKFNDVYKVVQSIPVGRVTTYKAIACYLGYPKGARIVSRAMSAGDGKVEMPAHRVVSNSGKLTGYKRFHVVSMEDRLAMEGINVNKNTIINFDSVFWYPDDNLKD